MKYFSYLNLNCIFKLYLKSNFYIFFLKVILILFINILIKKTNIYNEFFILNNKKLISKKEDNLFEYLFFEKLIINIFLLNYTFSFKYNITKVEYNIGFYDKTNCLIKPSEISLYYKIHIFCQTNLMNSNTNIKYIANIYQNQYYNCIEYFNIDDKIKLGITIYKNNRFIEYYTIYLFEYNSIDYNNNIFINNNEFDPLFQINKNKKLNYLAQEETVNVINNNIQESFLLKNAFYQIPKFTIKPYSSKKENEWYFKNIYNNYFCFCKYSINSNCLYRKINKKCKYYLYLKIIDNNKKLYNKTKYLFADFSTPEIAVGEAYLVFKEMVKENLSAYFLTKREDIYNQFNIFNYNYSYMSSIILGGYFINGDFLEKHLDLFLKLKAVISGARIYSIDNLFYNIEYITYICLGHGISYLKDFLYKDYYSNRIYNKILLPPSDIIISNAKTFGWNDNDIIKIGLPRWDIFNNYEKNLVYNSKNETENNKSIFVMFTWRDLKKNQTISKYYLSNILKLINNIKLNNILRQYNFSLYYSLHHMIEEYKILFIKNKFIKYISQDQIIECLTKAELIITDFSSIIFDIIVRKKPYIIFIPDSDDPDIYNIYNITYCNIINSLKNGKINFENRFFNVNDTVNKIIYYFNNDFHLEPKMKLFYNTFKFKGGNNTKSFINYLKNL